MRSVRLRLALTTALVLALTMAFAPAGMAAPKPNVHRAEKWLVYQAKLDPLNNSGVKGLAKVYVHERDGHISVSIYAAGLEPGKQHLQHIHGFSGVTTDSVCPPASAAGPDGILSFTDGLPFYGPVLLPLSLPDGTFPIPNQFDEIHYLRSFGGQAALLPMDLRTIVLHGMTVNGTYDPTLPVACGPLEFKGFVIVKNCEIEKFKMMGMKD